MQWTGAIRIGVQIAAKNAMQFLGLNILIGGLELRELFVDHCDVISCLDSHSDGTHSLQKIH